MGKPNTRFKETATIMKKLQMSTKYDLLNKLDLFGKCGLVRCTGFGKTWMLSELVTSFTNVLYLYPAEVVRDTVQERIEAISEEDFEEEEKKAMEALVREISEENGGADAHLEGVTFMTYMKLIRMKEGDWDALPGFDLVVMDECHRIGADKTKVAVRALFDAFPRAKFVGATATPVRSDAVDVIKEYFGGICTFEYTLHDAFADGIIMKPVYTYMTQDPLSDIRDYMKEKGLPCGRNAANEILKSGLLEEANLLNIPESIRNVTERHRPDALDYMKYIVFFADLGHMRRKRMEVKRWFREAFPGMKINELEVTSGSKKSSENVHKLKDMAPRKNAIDLVFCVDMINMGYHVPSLTGIVMYRGTHSATVFAQQLGRALAAGGEKPCIVFDIVDNLHRKSLYETYKKTEATKRKRKATERKMADRAVERISLSAIPEDVKEAASAAIMAILSGEVGAESLEDAVREQAGGLSPEQESIILEMAKQIAFSGGLDPWWPDCNDIHSEDLVCDVHEAEYRELIAKIAGEPFMQRAKMAYQEHLKRWVAMNPGAEYPATKRELESPGLMPPLEPYSEAYGASVSEITEYVLSRDEEERKRDVESAFQKALRAGIVAKAG